jgi:hypothetical protein
MNRFFFVLNHLQCSVILPLSKSTLHFKVNACALYFKVKIEKKFWAAEFLFSTAEKQ